MNNGVASTLAGTTPGIWVERKPDLSFYVNSSGRLSEPAVVVLRYKRVAPVEYNPEPAEKPNAIASALQKLREKNALRIL